MKVFLVSAPTISEARSAGELDGERRKRIPLAPLCLASVLEVEGIGAEVVDLDRHFLEWLEGGGRASDDCGFPESVADMLAGSPGRLFGFGSICSSYALTLQVAAALKRRRPDARIVLGGPQATAAAEETLAAFPAVDVVVRGEGELVLPALVRALEAGEDLRGVRGIAWRGPAGIVRTQDSPLLTDLDSLPPPAYLALPYLRDYGFLPVEAGRGCPFSCTFCSTSQFFRRRFRARSVPRLVDELVRLRDEFGTTSFEIVHDNFTVDRARVAQFCEALISRTARVEWSCSARTDCIDDELIDLMRKAGCRGLFFGVESGSPRMQAVIGKGLDVDEARARIRHASRRRIASSVAMIAGFHEETVEDLAKTVRFFVDTLRDDYAEPQLSLLSPLTGTPVHRQHAGRLVLDDLMSDMAFQGFELEPRDRDLIAANPWIFSSYYSVPTPGLDRRYVGELRLFLLGLRFQYRWLLVALEQVAGDLLGLFSTWRGWQSARYGPAASGGRVLYYCGSSFPRQFLTFVREEVAARYPAVAHVLLALAAHAESVAAEDGAETAPPPAVRRHVARVTAESVPVLAPGVRVVRLQVDLARVVACLRRRRGLERIPVRETTVVTRARRERTEVVRLSAASADLLALCDGQREARAVAELFARGGGLPPGVPGLEAGLVGLELLRRDGLLCVARPRSDPPRPV